MQKRACKKGNKRGQFYLIAAIIVITIAAGFVTVSNYVSSRQSREIYYLRDEIKIESSRVIDYISLNSADFKTVMINFSQQYMNNTFGNNYYFILGTDSAMTFLSYQSTDSSVVLNGEDRTDSVGTEQIYSEDFSAGENVTLTINENDYVFKLEIGNNYGFLISNEKGGQNYIAQG